VLDLERFAEIAARPRGPYTAATVDSFMDYVEAHLDQDGTTIWVHPVDGTSSRS
jgi:hypothetical protein